VEAGGDRYALGAHPKVVRQSALEELIAHQPERAAALRSVVMIQCVEAEGTVEYCSRICCTNTIKNALRLKLLNPDCQVIILYKNIITYGFREKYYLEARRRGVLFVRYTEEQPPKVWVDAGGALQVSVDEHIFGNTMTFEPDLLALSMAVRPSPGTGQLAQMLGLKLSPEGFFHEAHLKMRPMDFADEGSSWPAWPTSPSSSRRASPTPWPAPAGRSPCSAARRCSWAAWWRRWTPSAAPAA